MVFTTTRQSREVTSEALILGRRSQRSLTPLCLDAASRPLTWLAATSSACDGQSNGSRLSRALGTPTSSLAEAVHSDYLAVDSISYHLMPLCSGITAARSLSFIGFARGPEVSICASFSSGRPNFQVSQGRGNRSSSTAGYREPMETFIYGSPSAPRFRASVLQTQTQPLSRDRWDHSSGPSISQTRMPTKACAAGIHRPAIPKQPGQRNVQAALRSTFDTDSDRFATGETSRGRSCLDVLVKRECEGVEIDVA